MVEAIFKQNESAAKILTQRLDGNILRTLLRDFKQLVYLIRENSLILSGGLFVACLLSRARGVGVTPIYWDMGCAMFEGTFSVRK